MAEIAKLVEVVFDDKASGDLFQRVRSDPSLKPGLEKFYSIVKLGVETVGGGKLGFECWEQSEVRAVGSVAYAIAHATRSLSVEQAEPAVVAVVQKSLEFAICYLEKSASSTDDLAIQNNMAQLLEIAMIEGIDKDSDLPQPCFVDTDIDLMLAFATGNSNIDLGDHVRCMLQGGHCSRDEKPADRLLMTLASECVQPDTMAQIAESTSHQYANKLVSLFRHWAAAHLGCIQRLISLSKELTELPHMTDEKMICTNFRKRLSFCLKIFRLLKLIVKDISFVEYDAALLQSIASFCDALPNLFRPEFDIGNSNAFSESSPEGLVLLLLEEFILLVQVIFCNCSVVNNIRACMIASVLGNLNNDVWSWNKTPANQRLPLACFPRVLCYMLKLIMDSKQWREHAIVWEEFGTECSGSCIESQNNSPAFHVHSEKILLLKKYKFEELLEIIFHSSKQWLDHLMHVLLFLHSEGIKLKPKLERLYSSGSKTACGAEQESAICQEEEALFGDLFSEGGRSAGSADGYDQSTVAVSSTTNFCNMPMQAATELLSFLKLCVFSPDWHPSIYEDSCRKFKGSHIKVLLFLLKYQFSCSEDSTTSEIGLTSHEQSKIGNIQLLCFDLLHNLLLRHALSAPLEEYLVEEVLKVENGVYVYNDQTLTLLGHALICRAGLAGSQLRIKTFRLYVEFIKEKAIAISSVCPALKELLETLPSTYHIEILLMAFHLSSDAEKETLSKIIFSSLIEVVAACSNSLNSTQLSCWALIVSRLVLVLRHMMYYPHACPPSLLLELRSKLRKGQVTGLCPPNDVKAHLSSWASVVVGNLTATQITDVPLCGDMLNQLLDIAPLPASVLRDELSSECLFFSWGDLCATFSQILGFWRGTMAATMDDLIVERYMFVLCWDVPFMSSRSEHLLHFWSGIHGLDASNMEHFFCFSHSLLGNCGSIAENVNFPEMVFGLLQHFYDLDMSADIAELQWDFLRNGSWLSLLLSFFSAGISRYCMTKSIELADPLWSQHTSRDSDFHSLAEGLVLWVFDSKQVPLLLRMLSSLLNGYLRIYQRTFLSALNSSQDSPDNFSPLLLLKYDGFDKCMRDELLEKAGISPSQLESAYNLLVKLDGTIDKLSSAFQSNIFWEFVLHGFPSHVQNPSGGLISCLLNIKGIICFLDKLLSIKDADGVTNMETEVLGQILDSVMTIKSDKLFASLHGKCESVYLSLSEGIDGPDYSCLCVLKHMELFLRDINGREVCGSSIHEGLVSKAIDTLDSLREDLSRAAVFRFFLCLEDVSAQVKDLYDSKRGNLLVLFDSLDKCNSGMVNVKVLNFLVELTSGESCPGMKQKIQEKLLGMDLLSLSKWLERRLLGPVGEALGGGTTSAKGSSVPLRESTMNFMATLLSPVSDPQSKELHNHLFEAMMISLDTAFMLFDTHTAKSYFSFVVQLTRDESSTKSLLQQSLLLMKRLAGKEHLLQGLKFLFGFLGTVMNDCGTSKLASERSFGRSSSGNSSNVGPVASRSLSSRKNSETFVLSANQEGGSTSLECDATSADEDDDDGTSDGEVGSMDKDDEDDSNSERALASKVCTFTSSGSNFMEQHWYFCYTCDLTVSKGCCSVCAKVCHRGHRVVYSRSSRFFCDCGAGGVRGSSCQCLKARKFTPNTVPTRGPGNFQSFLPFTDDGDQLPDSDSDIDEDIAVDSENSIRLAISGEMQDRMPMLLAELDIEGQVLEICSSLLPCITSRRDSGLSKDKKIILGEDKVMSCSVDLLQLRKAYKSGSLDLKIKADYSNAKELKSHLVSGSLVKSLLSASTRGRLAVGEGDKVAIFDVGQLIGQATIAPVTADKANVKPLSKNVIRFEIVHLVFNPVVESYLAVAGYEDCQVLTVSHRGEVTDRLAIELALQGAYIRRVEWVPGSQVQLMVVTNKFVKIYDLSQDNISPMHYFTLPDDMIVDATLVSSQGRMFIVVLSELGCLFRLEISEKGNVGAKPLKELIQIPDRDALVKGSSLYFSPTYKLLFLSYQNGTTLIGRLNPDATSLSEMSSVYEDEHDGKLRLAGLHRWKELLSGSGLFVCFSTVKNNAAFAVSMGEHEIFAQNLRHSVGSTSPLVGVTAYKPLSKDKIHCLVLHDDGSLQIYSYIPVGIDASASAMSEKVKRLGSGILNNKAYAGSNPEFPLDFFEKTICITADVKLSGDAIRNGDSEGAKQSLTSEDGFLESPSPAGFKITVSNSNPDIVMVGFRVHVGNTSANHIPSSITIFHRVIKLDEGMRSWYDIPFTVAESLLADEEFTISVGPTFNGSALSRIDSLEVYGRAKDEFGWKEKMEAVLNMEARVLGCNSPAAGIRKKHHMEQSAPISEQVVTDGLKFLSRFYSLCRQQGCSKVDDVKMELSKLKCRQLLEIIYESDKEPLLQSAACCVLQAVFPKREIYLQVKDTLRLLGVVKSTAVLSSRLGVGGTTTGWIIEEFTAQMRAVSKIALHHRGNLATFLETNGSEVVDGLMQVLWGVLDIEQPDTQTMNNIVVSSVELIYCYAECLALHGKGTGGHSVAPAVSLLKQLLFSSNEAVQTSSSLAISSRLLQVPFPKQTMLGADDVVDNAATIPIPADVTTSAGGNTQIMVEEDSITSSVQYCCDGCSTVPILRRRWHCTVCPDFDLCEACYEIRDADQLPPPHSIDHPMSAIPIEAETLGGESNESHFSTHDLTESSPLPGSAGVGTQSSTSSIHVLESNESGEFSTSVIDPVTISASKRAVNSLLLSELLEQLAGWMEVTSGVQAIPVMQLFYRLSSAVGGPFVDSSMPESLDLEKLIRWFLDEINLTKSFSAKTRSSFGEVAILVFMFFTLMLRNWHQPGTDVSLLKSSGTTDRHEKNIIQVPPSSTFAHSSLFDDQKKNDFASQLHQACGSLRQQAFVNYLMDILQQLVHVFKSQSVNFDNGLGSSPGTGCGALLTVRRELPAGNFSPFFSDSYAKSHRMDIFADYHRLLLENVFRLVYSLVRPEKHDKAGEKEKAHKISSSKELKLDEYQDVLCSYINNPNTTFVRRYARRLFLHLCGSKTHYYSIRDAWQFSSEVKRLYKYKNKSGSFQDNIPYERSVKILKCLSTVSEVAAARPRNWQKYCLRHGDVLPFLMEGLFFFGEESVVQTLKLLNLAFYAGKDTIHYLQKSEVGDTGTSSSKTGTPSLESKKKKKGEDGTESGSEKSYLDMEPAIEIFTGKGGDILGQFIDCFLLEWNSSCVRAEAKCVLFGVWHHGKQTLKEALLAALLCKVKCLPMYGQNIIEYTELVTCLLGRVPDNVSKQQRAEILDRCLSPDVIRCIFETLHSQNELLANHPNSRIYNVLSGLVEFDGYYLESEPCVACSMPEVSYSRMKLESLKSETKFTDNRIIVKCAGSYTIQSVTMNVHDARKSKSVKVLNLYYNNRPVADLSELKNNWALWKRAKSCHLAFNQTELKVDFPIPITVCNFMIELDSFYENLQALSLEPLQCPRCSRPVTDKHGICGNCHENAYQCRQCRNINYENLDSFLCNECGFSKYGRFEFNFMAKPSFTFDSMENDEDMKRGLAAIESESENAHRRYQQLLGFKKPLLKIVSSIGENEMDSQQKDSVQQMMVSLPGPSCKINRKIALLGVLYGEKCKAAFDSVSKSVQTLQGLKRVLMNYLHQKNSDNAVASSRFVVSRSPSSCYGCASTFVTQCLEILQVLSKHPNSKKQLVSAGILSELFENDIHQGPKTARVQSRAALCAFSEGEMAAVAELNSLIQKKVMYCLEHHRSMDTAVASREELLLLSEVCSLADEFWESRLRVVFQLLFSSIKLGAKHPAISEHVILPCLRIISQACTPPKPEMADKDQVKGKPPSVENNLNPSMPSSSLVTVYKPVPESFDKNGDSPQKTQDIQLLSYYEWEKGASYLDFVRRQYKVGQAVKGGQRSRPQRYDYLALKYALRWKRRACRAKSELASFELGSWVTELVLSACSQSIRSEMCMLITLLCGQSSSRRFRLLNLLMSFLPATLSAGENAAEYFEMLFKMIDSEDARLFLTVRGCLSTISKLITQEVGKIESLERSLHIDISQGFILQKLIELLGNFLEVPNIRSRFMQEKLLSEVLEAFIIIRGLIVQKTKLISDCNKLLKDLIDSLLLESNENKRQFIRACINGLQIHGEERKGRTSLFILEQLCNLICPSKPEPVYLLVLNKAHTQEEFIRGSMTKNPYSSAEIGPLMRDVKNKICHQLDLLGLLEDDYGMELLVAGNIISLDLSIAQVYEQVWRKSNATLLSSNAVTSGRDCPPMTVTYRLQGLDGEATEPMIKELEEDREESQDPEVEFAIAGAVRDCGGLEIILGMIQRLREDLKFNQEQLVAVLNLLMLCCKKRDNRRALLRLGALTVLLETARHAFSVDAMEPAEGILLIVESLTLEANESDNISITQSVLTVSRGETGTSEQAKKIVLMFLERLCHPSGLKKSNKQQRNTEMVARILPYLTYGEPAAMEALIQHFDPYLQNWGEFDQLQKQYQENHKDESIAQKAMKQRFAVENFVRVSESLKTSSCGERLKDIILETGITRVAVGYLRENFAFTAQAGFKFSAERAVCLKLPSVPLILSMLRGLSMGHLATQKCIDKGGILPLLHALEGVSGENEIGARAENLLDTLCDKEAKGDGYLAQKIHGLRHATRDEMRQQALRKRKEILQGLGMREVASDGGGRIVLDHPVLEGLEDVKEEEDGLACMVCREGYNLRPTDILGAYSYSKRVKLGVGTSGSARGEYVYTTVSHFNIIHFQCHQEAKRNDAALKNPKKEWEGATLRNNETLCNNLFPLRGPSVPVPQYIRYVDMFWDNLNALGRADGSHLRLLTYDVVLMLARFATGASFSQDSKGGGKESNSRFLPFMIQMACHLLDHGNSSQRRTMAKAVSTYLTSSPSDSKPSAPSGTQSSTGTEETVQFMMVNSLLSESYESWLQHRCAFLQRGIYHAYMQHTHGRSNHHSSSHQPSPSKELGENDDLLPIIQPMLVYTGLIEQLQRFFKVKRSASVGSVIQADRSDKESDMEDDNGSLDGWEVIMRERLLNVKEMVGFSREFLSWLEEMTSASHFQESFDIIGVLTDVLSGGFSRCEDFVYAAINGGERPRT